MDGFIWIREGGAEEGGFNRKRLLPTPATIANGSYQQLQTAPINTVFFSNVFIERECHREDGAQRIGVPNARRVNREQRGGEEDR